MPETPMTAQYDAANRLTSLTLNPNTPEAKTYNLTYDLEGNLTKKQATTDASCTQDCTEYVWDGHNRLSQLQQNGQTTAQYSYDAQGRRTQASISTAGVTQTVHYIHDGDQAVGEVRNGNLSHSLMTGLFIDEHLARTTIATNGQATSQALLTDALGSVLALAKASADSANGQIDTTYSYSAYGQTSQQGTSGNPSQYTGRENDGTGAAGLYYYRARYYDPVLKRFISEDPIRLSGGLNVYAYVEGDPVSNIDPFGLMKCHSQDGDFREKSETKDEFEYTKGLEFPAPGGFGGLGFGPDLDPPGSRRKPPFKPELVIEIWMWRLDKEIHKIFRYVWTEYNRYTWCKWTVDVPLPCGEVMQKEESNLVVKAMKTDPIKTLLSQTERSRLYKLYKIGNYGF